MSASMPAVSGITTVNSGCSMSSAIELICGTLFEDVNFSNRNPVQNIPDRMQKSDTKKTMVFSVRLLAPCAEVMPNDSPKVSKNIYTKAFCLVSCILHFGCHLRIASRTTVNSNIELAQTLINGELSNKFEMVECSFLSFGTMIT